MSTTNSEAEKVGDMCCASCGIAEVDDIKLKTCTACKSVRYCSVKCQRDHRPEHKKACKKRAAEIRDEILFKQPESIHIGDCPICFLPLSIHAKKSTLMACCSKVICDGCNYANQKRETEKKMDPRCPFCRHPASKTDEEFKMNLTRRIQVNDPVALRQMSSHRYDEGDYEGAFEYLKKATELGDAGAHFQLSCLYRDGRGVEKDKKKQLHHLEQAAIVGDPYARHNLGVMEVNDGRLGRAMNHFIIAAKLGYGDSLDALKEGFQEGLISKEDFASALRAHQAAVDATKSPQRDAGEAALQNLFRAAKAAR